MLGAVFDAGGVSRRLPYPRRPWGRTPCFRLPPDYFGLILVMLFIFRLVRLFNSDYY